jgi:hypothetical protein
LLVHIIKPSSGETFNHVGVTAGLTISIDHLTFCSAKIGITVALNGVEIEPFSPEI